MTINTHENYLKIMLPLVSMSHLVLISVSFDTFLIPRVFRWRSQVVKKGSMKAQLKNRKTQNLNAGAKVAGLYGKGFSLGGGTAHCCSSFEKKQEYTEKSTGRNLINIFDFLWTVVIKH